MKELIYWTVFVFLTLRAGLGFDPTCGSEKCRKKTLENRSGHVLVLEERDRSQQANERNGERRALNFPADLCTLGLHEIR
jgi:hypothetical protein